MNELKWGPPDSEGGTFSKSDGNRSSHGRVPYVVEKRHDGFSLSVSLLIRGLDSPERARGVAQDIQGMIDGDDALDGRSIVLTKESLEKIVTDVIDAQFWDVHDTIADGIRVLQAAILAKPGGRTKSRNCPASGREEKYIEEPGDFGSVIGGEWVHEDDGSMECEVTSVFDVGDVVRFIDGPIDGESKELTVVSFKPAGNQTSYTLLDEANPGADIRSYGTELELVRRR